MDNPEPTSDYFQGKSAVVTGAASGIGLALVEQMLDQGIAAITLADVNAEALASQSARLSDSFPGKVLALCCDVTSEERVQSLVQQAVGFSGNRLDLLFNNAGAGFGGVFERQTNENWEQAFALNFYGPLYGIRAALPFMRRQGAGHIVNIISGIAFAPMAQQSRYAATKAALNALTLALRYELWDEGIRLSSATPGTTATDIWKAGGKEPPAHAQAPEAAARAILAGVACNDRLILGDDRDARGARNAFASEAAQAMDDYLLDVARRRQKGEAAV